MNNGTQPPAPTVAEVRDLVANAQSRRFIELTVPRSRVPRGKRVTLLSRSGPLSIKPDPEDTDRHLMWDGRRRAVTASWRVEDLRAWVESIGGAEVAADMSNITIESSPEAFEITVATKPINGRATINTMTIRVESIAHLGRVYEAIGTAVSKVVSEIEAEAKDEESPAPEGSE